MAKKEKHAEVNVTPTSVKTNNMFNYVFKHYLFNKRCLKIKKKKKKFKKNKRFQFQFKYKLFK